MDLQVMVNEIIGTFLFVSVILMVKGEHTAGDRKGVCAAMCVTATLLTCITGTTRLGACFNPAVGISLSAFSVMKYSTFYENTHFMTHYTYAYTLGPALGGLLAGLFHLVHKKAFEPDERD